MTSVESRETRETGYPVRESWFKAYKEGNLLLPQVFNGIAMSVCLAVLKDKPERWEEFSKSELTDEQEISLETMANRVHDAMRITNKEVKLQQLRNLWNHTKLVVVRVMLEIVIESSQVFSTHTIYKGLPFNTIDVNQYLTNELEDKLKKILEEVLHICSTNKEVQSLITNFRKSLVQIARESRDDVVNQKNNVLKPLFDSIRQILDANSSLAGELLERFKKECLTRAIL